VTLSQICRSSYQNPFAFPGGDIPEDLRRKFDQWWSNQLSPQASMTPKLLPFMGAPPAGVNNDIEHNMGTAALAAAAAAAAAAQAGLHAASTAGSNIPTSISASRESLLLNDSNSHHTSGVMPGTPTSHHTNMMVHPAMHASMHHHASLSHSQFSNQKTRMRTSFDPEMELPRLQKWFQENPHPSRQQIQAYVVQLNALESRRGRKPLDVNNVVYWFKNARAAQKRAEMRGGFGAMQAAMNGYLGQHSQLGQTSGGSSTGSMSSQQQIMGSSMGNLSLSNDFMKSPLSLKSEDIDTMSQHSDDLDDDQSRPNSPQLPLSLTIHERHQTDSDQANDNKVGLNDHISSMATEVDEKPENLSESQNERSQSRSYEEREKYDSNNLTKEEHHTEEGGNASGEPAHHNNGDGEDQQRNESETNNNSSNSLNNNNSSSGGCGSNNTTSNNNNNQSLDNSHNNSRPSSPKPTSSKEDDEDLDMDDDDDDDDNDASRLHDFRSPSPDMNNAMMAAAAAQRKDLPFPMVPNNMFSQSFMYMSHYMPGFGQAAAAAAAGHPHAAAAHHAAAAAAAAGMQANSLMPGGGLNLSNISSEERRKRNRTFIDPVTEVPKLEQWFAMNTHPSHSLILKYTEDLNTMPYRQKFPRLESKNVQFWFKNRRAKCKRLKMSLYDPNQCSQLAGLNSFVHKYEERD
ncbi:bromodomain-containing protein DDB_G0270170-like, partial [Musca vetustissima]|uniref:bromodomain-containing protein DDB_G0270170-like n=1 Tax=Musca vetustissima TaxID=27455 RepID=UPI002AB6779C